MCHDFKYFAQHIKIFMISKNYMCLELMLIPGICFGRPPDLDLAKLFADLTLSGSTTQVILDRICKNMIILTPQRKSLKA